MTTLYLIRHAESQGNASFEQGVFLPKTPLGSSLTEKGIKQAQQLQDQLSLVHLDAIFSSPFNRAKETAEVINASRRLDIHIISDLQERKKGLLGGASEEKLRQTQPFLFGDTNELTDDELFSWKLFDDMETAAEAVGRFTTALQTISKKHPNETVAVVTHGNVLRSFLVKIGWGSFKQLGAGSIQNCGYVRVVADEQQITVEETSGIIKTDQVESN